MAKTQKVGNKFPFIQGTRNIMRPKFLVVVVSVLAILGIVYLVSARIHAADYPLPNRVRSSAATGPLRVNPTNPRYLMDENEKVVFLAGSNYWNLIQDGGRTNPPPAFDFESFIKFAVEHGYNYMKPHIWEQAWHQSYGDDWYTQPTIYKRTGPGNAWDGDPKFDLDQFNDEYFDRLRARVIQAGQAGIYIGLPLFDRFSVQDGNTMSDQWYGHPFNADNNINGIDGDPTTQGHGLDTETLIIPEVTAYQEAYVRHVVDVLNDLDNVIWEVAQEPDGYYSRDGFDAFGWVDHMIDYIHTYEATKPKQHPVLYSAFIRGGDNDMLFASKAEMIAPDIGRGFSFDSPYLDGTKVVLVDTDHILWTDTKGADWAWRAFTRGAGGFAMMDGGYSDYDDQGGGASYADAENFRYNLGWILDWANRINLAAMTPRPDLCSTSHCLVNPVAGGAEYLIYVPSGSTATAILETLGMRRKDHRRLSSIYLPTDSRVTVDLSGTPGSLSIEWFNPRTGKITPSGTVEGGGIHCFIPPFFGGAVLYLYQSN